MSEDSKTNKKRMAAAIAAVTAYIKSQEEMMAAQAGAMAEAAPARPMALPSLWGVSGRQDMMQYRNMMQMKAFHGARSR